MEVFPGIFFTMLQWEKDGLRGALLSVAPGCPVA